MAHPYRSYIKYLTWAIPETLKYASVLIIKRKQTSLTHSYSACLLHKFQQKTF